jgi:hypothetical protein
MGQIYTNVGLDSKLHKEIMLLKIRTDAKSAREVIARAVKILKDYMRENKK